MDHDQRLKTLLRTFFADFLLLFFADWAARLDLSAIDWLDQELFPNPPEGTRHAIDLVAKVGVREPVQGSAASLLLVHIEIAAADRTTELKPRLPYYYHFLRDKHRLPVLPLVLYLKVGLDGIGIDTCVEDLWGLEINRFQYLYVGLPGLDAIQYVQGDSWLGVALSALMRIPRARVVWLGAEALRRLAGAPLTEQERFLLGECVEAYLPLDEASKLELERLKEQEPYREARAMNQTTYEKGIEKGIERGRRALVVDLLEERFGPASVSVCQVIEQLSSAELRRLALRIGQAASLAELGLPNE